jgi:hypothetical protein
MPSGRSTCSATYAGNGWPPAARRRWRGEPTGIGVQRLAVRRPLQLDGRQRLEQPVLRDVPLDRGPAIRERPRADRVSSSRSPRRRRAGDPPCAIRAGAASRAACPATGRPVGTREATSRAGRRAEGRPFDQLQERRHEELGDRAGAVGVVSRSRRLPVEVGVAEGPAKEDLVSLHDGHGEAGQVPLRPLGLEPFREAGRRRGKPRGRSLAPGSGGALHRDSTAPAIAVARPTVRRAMSNSTNLPGEAWGHPNDAPTSRSSPRSPRPSIWSGGAAVGRSRDCGQERRPTRQGTGKYSCTSESGGGHARC